MTFENFHSHGFLEQPFKENCSQIGMLLPLLQEMTVPLTFVVASRHARKSFPIAFATGNDCSALHLLQKMTVPLIFGVAS